MLLLLKHINPKTWLISHTATPARWFETTLLGPDTSRSPSEVTVCLSSPPKVTPKKQRRHNSLCGWITHTWLTLSPVWSAGVCVGKWSFFTRLRMASVLAYTHHVRGLVSLHYYFMDQSEGGFFHKRSSECQRQTCRHDMLRWELSSCDVLNVVDPNCCAYSTNDKMGSRNAGGQCL